MIPGLKAVALILAALAVVVGLHATFAIVAAVAVAMVVLVIRKGRRDSWRLRLGGRNV